MRIELTITISVIIALASVISPIIVAKINNKHHLKLRKLELSHDYKCKQLDIYYSDKKQAFEAFTKSAGEYRLNPDHRELAKLQSSAYSAMLFCNEQNKDKINSFVLFAVDNFHSDYRIENIKKYDNSLFKVSSILNDELINLSEHYNTSE